MTTFLGSYERPRRQPLGETSRIGRLVRLSEDTLSAVVELGNEQFELPVSPGKYVLGANVAVLESKGKPRRVSGPAGVWPEGLDADADAPVPVTAVEQLGPRELTEAEAQAIQDTADGLADAQGRVSAAEGLLDAIGASDGPDGVADAIGEYLAIPLDQITVVDNRGADGNVVANLYDAIIVEGLLTASGVITENLIATGAVESRHLNVVPEEGTGGLKLDAYGMDVIGPDTGEATTYVSFRADQANAISFVQDGKSTFSVSPEGDLSAATANIGSLTVAGTTIEELLAPFARGLVARSELQYNVTDDGTTSELCSATFTPEPGRAYRIVCTVVAGSATSMRYYIGLSFSRDRIYRRLWPNDATPVNSYQSRTFEAVFSAEEIGYLGEPSTISMYGQALQAGTVIFSGYTSSSTLRRHTDLQVYDVGLAVPLLWQTMASNTGAGDAGDSTPAPQNYTQTFSPTWTRSFLGNGSFYNYGAGRAYHGQYLAQNGILGSAVGFNRTQISSHTASGEIVKVEVFLKNAHTYAASGMTVQWGTHSYTSVPSSYSVPVGGYSHSFKKGEGRWITLPEADWAAWKSGGSNGIRFKPSTTSSTSYGYFDGTATRVRITVRK